MNDTAQTTTPRLIQAGDRVRCVDPTGEWLNDHAADTFTVAETYPEEQPDPFLRLQERPTTRFRMNRFALANDAPPVAIGPRDMRCLNAGDTDGMLAVGQVYTVTGEEEDAYEIAGTWWSRDRFETAVPPNFVEGQRIRQLRVLGGWLEHYGSVGHLWCADEVRPGEVRIVQTWYSTRDFQDSGLPWSPPQHAVSSALPTDPERAMANLRNHFSTAFLLLMEQQPNNPIVRSAFRERRLAVPTPTPATLQDWANWFTGTRPGPPPNLRPQPAAHVPAPLPEVPANGVVEVEVTEEGVESGSARYTRNVSRYRTVRVPEDVLRLAARENSEQPIRDWVRDNYANEGDDSAEPDNGNYEYDDESETDFNIEDVSLNTAGVRQALLIARQMYPTT